MVPNMQGPGGAPGPQGGPSPAAAQTGCFLLVLNGPEPAAFATALHRLAALPLLRLPYALLVRAPVTAREALAALPGVAHAGGVDMPARPPRRIRVPAAPAPSQP
jgi:hypothetical protein